MKCDKSFKRHVITVWSMDQLGKGVPLSEVTSKQKGLWKMSTTDLQAFVAESRKAVAS